jgi:hypothetical protein
LLRFQSAIAALGARKALISEEATVYLIVDKKLALPALFDRAEILSGGIR